MNENTQDAHNMQTSLFGEMEEAKLNENKNYKIQIKHIELVNVRHTADYKENAFQRCNTECIQQLNYMKLK